MVYVQFEFLNDLYFLMHTVQKSWKIGIYMTINFIIIPQQMNKPLI